MANRIITFAYSKNDGLVISRVGNEIAVPVLDFEKIGHDGDFRGPTEYHLERCSVLDIGRDWPLYVWTKKIPIELKNRHRAFWGMKPLRERATA